MKSKGHNVFEINFPYFEEVVLGYGSLLSAEGNLRTFKKAIKNEPLMKEYNTMRFNILPNWLRYLTKFVLKFIGENRLSNIIMATNGKSVSEYYRISKLQDHIKKKTIKWWIEENELDCLISPGLATPAIHHGESENLALTCCYTFIWNFLDFPTGVVPITKVKEGEDVYIDNFHNDRFSKLTKKSLKGSVGLPLGVQLSCLPFKEELCLNVMKQLEDLINFHEYPEI